MTAAEPVPAAANELDVPSIRAQFPVLERVVHGKPLTYLDNAATTQKPNAVIETLERFYREYNSNVHRGVHLLSQEATNAFEDARESTRRFLGADHGHEIIFTRGTTESVNLVAYAWGRANVKAGDEILVTEMEHHSNIVPWQMLCEAVGATLRVIPMDDRGQLRLDELDALLTEKTKLLAVVHVSNALGTLNPVELLIARAHAVGALVLVDGAQAVPHLPVDVKALDADFYAFSGHKVFGPTGIGVLYGKTDVLEAMPPWQGGGDMIRMVTFEKTTYAALPAKLEAGTPNVSGAIGLGAALDWLDGVGRASVAAHEADLLAYGTEVLGNVKGLRFIGEAEHRAGALSFLLEGIHPHDVGTILDREGVAVRTGHHCAYPVMQHFGVPATTRASLAVYNTKDDLDALVRAIGRVHEVFA